ncbi:PREDICTED: dolichyl-phosphate beta-glucosyltransferase isoform X2 [Cyphomyrmex costatus]|uniref:Dolichyl-phosphate beta-glucosyltransferase n=1 Tax=Cyphomyrmex costatus TaxID=456900 RepID=A0A151IM96_9HYME|nr:PREDICTED: dolichyl-phosphate beta-glucosyltransferase isoform X2 [Cyphomyrmex costatus]KYN06012.1 Dolichyl-phosphate beta-glucosyltransferase [Cyphomyrmex costatus]
MLSSGCLLYYGVLLIVLIIILFFIIIYVTSERYPKILRDKSEKFFFNCQTKTKEAFPSLYDPWSVQLSVIIPAYNEEERLPPMLDECLEYLEDHRKSGLTYEVIVVSDGSTDKTVDVAHRYALKYNTLKVLNLVKNRGKGGAVRLGMLSARGSALLFADADGATKFNDLKKLDESLINVLGFDYINKPEKTASSDAVICGSRAHLEKEETAKRSYFRLFLMHGFHFLVWLLCVRGIRDTQCGFKLLTRKSARTIFEALHVERWAFDVEMLYIAQSFNIPVTEIAVNWTEIEGSKIIPFWSWLQMGRDLFFIWLRYRIGAWKINKPKT